MSIAQQNEIENLKRRVEALEQAIQVIYAMPLGPKSEGKMRDAMRSTLALPEKPLSGRLGEAEKSKSA